MAEPKDYTMAEQKTYTRLSMASTAIGYTARCLRWLRRVRRRSGLFHPVRSDSSDSAASGHIAGQGDARYRGRRIVRCRPCTRPYFYSTRRVHRGPARERLAARYLAGDLPLAPSAMKRTQCRGRRRQAKAEASMSSSRTLSLSAPSAESETKAKAPP